MAPSELLECFAEVYDRCQEAEDLAGEIGDIKHGPFVGVEDCETPQHPTGVDQCPCLKAQWLVAFTLVIQCCCCTYHEGKEWDAHGVGNHGVEVFCNDGKRSRDTEYGQGLEGKE